MNSSDINSVHTAPKAKNQSDSSANDLEHSASIEEHHNPLANIKDRILVDTIQNQLSNTLSRSRTRLLHNIWQIVILMNVI